MKHETKFPIKNRGCIPVGEFEFLWNILVSNTSKYLNVILNLCAGSEQETPKWDSSGIKAKTIPSTGMKEWKKCTKLYIK